MSALLVLIVALPALAAVFCTVAGAGRAANVPRASALAAAAAFLCAVGLAIDVSLRGPVSAVISGTGGHQVLGLYADRITVVLLLLVCGVSAVVQNFARGYLHGDLRAGRFFAGTSLLTAATAAMVSAASLVGLGVAWTLAGVALCLLLNMYAGLPAARQGVRRTALAFAIGDGALWTAIALALLEWGNLDLRRLEHQAGTLAGRPALLGVFACLILVAALARSAQLPLQRWLPATLAAPTPVSAILHAGVINAGGVLLVRLSPLIGRSGPASTLMFCSGGATVIYGTALMLAKPDIKGALAHSTMGQMGFMIMTCGLGAFAAAIFHLVAHGMYKATLFLGSGGAVHRQVRHAKAPPRAGGTRASRALAALLAALLGGAAVLGAAAVLHPHVGGRSGSGGLLVFAWATAAAGAWGILQRPLGTATRIGGLALVGLASWAYVGWLRMFTSFLSSDLGGLGQHPAPPWLLGVVVGPLALLALLRLAGGRRAHDTLYVLALSAGHVMRESGARHRRPQAAGSGWTVLEPNAGAARP